MQSVQKKCISYFVLEEEGYSAIKTYRNALNISAKICIKHQSHARNLLQRGIAYITVWHLLYTLKQMVNLDQMPCYLNMC